MTNKIDFSLDRLPASQLRQLQESKLQVTITLAAKSPLYRHLWKNQPIENIKKLSDLRHLPFTQKSDILNLGSFSTLAVPLEEVIETHFSSGTTKKPVASFFTYRDIQESSIALARTWHMQGIRPTTNFGMLASYGLFSAGLLNHYAIQQLGAFVLPISSTPSEKIIFLLQEFGITATAAVASFYFHLLHKLESVGIPPDSLPLSTIIAGGEPFSETDRSFLEKHLNVTMYDQYGLCEINTGIAGECVEKNGLHLLADYVYPEIIDPVTLEPCAEGQLGELVLTTLGKEASPLVRYRTGDLTSITYERCRCGRTLPRIARIKERISRTIFYKGIKIEREYVRGLMEQADHIIDPHLWSWNFLTESNEASIIVKVLPTNPQKSEDAVKMVRHLIKKDIGINTKVICYSSEEIRQLEGQKMKHFVE